MLNVTADSNIYISALAFGGRALEFVDAARSGAFNLALSEVLLAEILRVLRDKFLWSADAVEEARQLIEEITLRTVPTEDIAAIASDPDDNRVLECAVAAGSEFVVTGDSDLLRLRDFRGVPILRLSEFLALIHRSEGDNP